MGDFLRNDMFDKYFMKIGAQDKTPATGYDSAHYLWPGILHGVVELVHPGMEDRMQPRTLRISEPFQGWVSATQSDFAPNHPTVRETGQQATRDSLNSISGCSRLKVVLPVEQPTPGTVDMRNILLVRQRSMVWHMFRILYTLTG